mgnify:CR=1 FL=1|jgi:hypothetical protein
MVAAQVEFFVENWREFLPSILLQAVSNSEFRVFRSVVGGQLIETSEYLP